MVDQGPKGYCAPATFERAMRYMLVPADMYLLATAATKPGGGTNTRMLAESAKRIVRSKARRIKDLDLEKDLKIRRVKTYIDKGVPILWCMRSLVDYNQIANKRTKERSSISDFSKWKEEIAEEAESEAPGMENIESNHHICMILGYNNTTNEIAVSDSWGKRYELRWIHIDIAKAVTSRGGFVIDL
jgi:predicted peroxiredoxin